MRLNRPIFVTCSNFWHNTDNDADKVIACSTAVLFCSSAYPFKWVKRYLQNNNNNNYDNVYGAVIMT